MRILGNSLKVKDKIKDMFQPVVEAEQTYDDRQLELNFESC